MDIDIEYLNNDSGYDEETIIMKINSLKKYYVFY